jgi:hypothetical protein
VSRRSVRGYHAAVRPTSEANVDVVVDEHETLARSFIQL